MMISRLTLRPLVIFSGATIADAGAVRELHRKAKKNQNLLIANSLSE